VLSPSQDPSPIADLTPPRMETAGYSWRFEIAFGAALLFETLLPLGRFHLRMSPADVALLVCVVIAGGAMVRGGHALLSVWLQRHGGPWLPHALGVIVVALVGGVGMLHGPPHYSLPTALLVGVVLVALMSWFAGHERARWRRIAGGLVSLAFFAFLILGIDINVLSLFPRHVSELGAIVASAWLMSTLAVAPRPPPRAAHQMLALGTAVAGLCVVLAPPASSRVASYLRRQCEVGTFLSPVSWARSISPSTYLTWGDGICPPAPQQPVMVRGPASNKNLLLITIDTLRRDLYLAPGQALGSAYPSLASVVAEGCRYERVRSPGASTHMAMPALYNGTLAWTSLQRPVLAAIADQAGMYARVFGNLWQISSYTGLQPGEGDPATPPTDLLIDEIDRAGRQHRPFMMVAHFLDLHLPRKSELLSQFSGDLRPVYARKLAALDRNLGRLFAAIKARGEWERTIVVITADHGEELNERGYSEHAFHLYDTVLGVPLITRIPGQACLPAETPATLIDVLPMLARGLDLQVQSPLLQGQWPPQPNQRVYAFSTVGGPFLSIIEGNQKLIVDARYGDTEIYDLGADPAEKHDIGGDLTPAIAARLARGPIPWNPLVPMPQRFRRVDGDQFDVCRSEPPLPSSRSATVQAPLIPAASNARLQ